MFPDHFSFILRGVLWWVLVHFGRQEFDSKCSFVLTERILIRISCASRHCSSSSMPILQSPQRRLILVWVQGVVLINTADDFQ
jgi:hypothetical protein